MLQFIIQHEPQLTGKAEVVSEELMLGQAKSANHLWVIISRRNFATLVLCDKKKNILLYIYIYVYCTVLLWLDRTTARFICCRKKV